MCCILRNAYARELSWLPIGPAGENRACCSRTPPSARIAGRRIADRRTAGPPAAGSPDRRTDENILTFIRGI